MWKRNDIFTGGEHYWIMPHNNEYAVMRETPDFEPENEIVVVGTYTACVKYLEDLRIANADYDLDL